MNIEVLRAFFGWCTIINGGLIIFAFLICAVAGDWVYRMHSLWFRIPSETLDRTLYGFLGVMKIIVIMLNLVPYVALVILS